MTVRPWNGSKDTAQLLRWYHDDPEMWENMGGEPPMTEEKVLEGIAMRRSHDAMYAIEDDDEVIGFVSVFPRITEDSGVVHIGISPDHRGKGLDAARVALDAARMRGYRHLIAPPAPRMNSATHQAWLRRVGFTVKHHGEWHSGE